ncbi:hypothetical protein HOY80DRAFT_1045839 [Tuber brumale]|nr:hypothetical protein HOY80DRAFT_1045839 [Tuber brumale]
MGRGFIGLARALRWAGPGSLGWAQCEASWVGLGWECLKPGLHDETDECFTLWRYFEVKWVREWVRNGRQRLKRYWLRFIANKGQENNYNFGSINRDHGQSEGLEQSTQSELLQDEEENRFSAWMDLTSSRGAVKDDYERYCLNSEPELAARRSAANRVSYTFILGYNSIIDSGNVFRTRACLLRS